MLCLSAVAIVGALSCTRERSRAITEEESGAAMEGPRDYREMLSRVRTKQSQAQTLEQLEEGIQAFQLHFARLPTNLVELIARGYVKNIPDPPPGKGYTYDPVHGNVGLMDLPDSSGIQLPPESTPATPVRLQEVSLPQAP